MSTLLQVIAFELKYYGKRLSTYAYFGIFFALSLLMVAVFGGAFDSANASIGGSDGKVFVNGPYVLMLLVPQLAFMAVLVTAALSGHAGYRDFGERMHPLVFTTPLNKWTWLTGRYIGSLLVNGFVLSSIALGLWLGMFIPGLDTAQFTNSQLSWFLAPYAIYVVPNTLFCAALFLSMAALSRRRMPHFVGGVLLLLGYTLAGILAGDLENRTFASLLDPFGFYAMEEMTRYWTTAEKNTLIPWPNGMVWANRALWMGISAAIFAGCGSLLRFQQEQWTGRKRGAGKRNAANQPAVRAQRLVLPDVHPVSDLRAQLAMLRATTYRLFRDILGNAYFLTILLAGVLFLMVSATQVGKLYGTETWPVTYSVIEVLGGSFQLFVVILITIYTGELVWHERDLKVQQLIDTLPMRSWVPWVAKGLALLAMLLMLNVVVMGAGILTQLVSGYTHLELGLYIESLFALRLVDSLLLTVLALTVHVLVNHKYLGHFLVILFYLFTGFQSALGLEHKLIQFQSDAGLVYSDMNQWGWFLGIFVWYKLYWGGVAIVLAALSNAFWVRGQDTALKVRLRLARARLRRGPGIAALVGLLLAIGAGSFIFYNTNVRNTYRTSLESELLRVRYEQDYKQYENLPQPRITDTVVKVDIFPYRGDLLASGTFTLENKEDEPIADIHVQYGAGTDIRTLQLSGRAWEATTVDEELGYRIYHLAEPLQPGERVDLVFDFASIREGFAHSGGNTAVVANGTFVNSSIFPSLGYSPNGELSSERLRRKHGLPERERMKDLDDPTGLANTYISADADWVSYDATVCTAEDQQALAPGYLQKEWTEDGRRCFHYVMDAPILHFTSYLSGHYQIERDSWNDVAIEIWHHPTHDMNVQGMITGVKKALEVYTGVFGPYQHRQVRIVEFPRYASFAQSFPNTIPYSEAIGFIAKVEEGEIDYPLYVTAHEVAHQWWAHQIIGANVQGSTVLSETLAQYSAMLVMQRVYGDADMERFLSYELDAYLQGRAMEGRAEQPLMRVENQQYIHYNKGSVVMWALRDAMGEAAVNRAIRQVLGEWKYQGPPYPTSRTLVDALRLQAGDEHQELITDLMETITLWDLRTTAATAVETPEGTQVTATIYAKKERSDDQGARTEIPMDEWLDVGIYDADDNLLLLEKHRITSDTTELTVVVPEGEPARFELDPIHLRPDRLPSDNGTGIERGEAS